MMGILWKLFIAVLFLVCCNSCVNKKLDSKIEDKEKAKITAKDILGNPDYQAICYGGYRENTRDIQPTVEQLQEDLRILSALGIKIIRTYNVHFPEASNILNAIHELKVDDPSFEMYVMLGVWIDCKNAWTDKAPDHFAESERNEHEIATAVALANQYPDIVKVLSVGNEAMVKWAERYYVQPSIILKWVKYLQQLKREDKLDKNLWITSSDDFASWGGGDSSYHTKDLEDLIREVDYISMHTYPYHNTHYNPSFWLVPESEYKLSEFQKAEAAMIRAKEFAKTQYDSVKSYMKSVGADIPVHIGETGWATISNGYYGDEGSRASDEFKQGEYYRLMRDWTNSAGISCFYFEAFDESWKDAANQSGSENHFGLFTVEGHAKYSIWNVLDQHTLDGLTRDGNSIKKTYDGDKNKLLQQVKAPPHTHSGISP